MAEVVAEPSVAHSSPLRDVATALLIPVSLGDHGGTDVLAIIERLWDVSSTEAEYVKVSHARDHDVNFYGVPPFCNIIILIIIILPIIRFLPFRMPSLDIYALEVSFGMRVIHSYRAIASTDMTSVTVRRMIQRTLVSSLSMTVSRIWSFPLADNCVLWCWKTI